MANYKTQKQEFIILFWNDTAISLHQILTQTLKIYSDDKRFCKPTKQIIKNQ